MTRLLIASSVFVAFAGAAAPPPPVKWTALFDGKSMEGWKESDFFGKGKSHVKGGALVMEKGKALTGVTYAGKDFPKTDYEFTFEAKKVDGDDFFCTSTFPVGESHCSFVVGGWSGTVVGLSNLDFQDASSNDTSKYMEFQTGRWYRITVRVTPKRIAAWIDGKPMVDADISDRTVGIRVECNACRPFGLCTYNTVGAVRDVRVRKLDGGGPAR
ncbi:MAG: 3-keto-disaccharide hydrolase [Gemmataceae bacterium]